jgi:mono/diheme cytochrome c family protein
MRNQKFNRRLFVLCLVFAATAFLLQSGDLSSQEKPRDSQSPAAAKKLFLDKVQPLLNKRCLGCHGSGKDIEGGLDLRTREAMLRGGENGPVVVLGKPEKSALLQAVLRTGDVVMPPKERNRLTPAEIATLRAWITAGAPWPVADAGKPADWKNAAGAKAVSMSTSGGLSADWTNRKYAAADVWAFRPVQRYSVPWKALGKNRDASSANPIDAFIRKPLNEKKLQPSTPAGKLTLIRRLTLDLTGLPPTSDEIEAFISNDSPNAYSKLVTRLLQSQRYGEQMARHWLDVVRYSDTAGFSNDYERPNAWRYRDYVIRAFNNDKPYDRFIVEQLAGDELDPYNPELLIASGFLRMGPWEHTGMSVAAVTRQQFLDDVTNAAGVTFMGQALRCAKCHDHKFDPLPTRDYYRIQAVFAPVQFVDRQVAYQPWENIAHLDGLKKLTEQRLADAQAKLDGLINKQKAARVAYLKERGVKNVKDLPKDEQPPSFLGLSKLELSLRKIYNKRRAYFGREMKRYRALCFGVYNGPPNGYASNNPQLLMPPKAKRRGKPDDVFILAGGSLATRLDEVSPGVLTAMAGANDTVTPTAWNSIPQTTEGRRLAFARWVASANNTLTARVIVNRIWQHHFGGNGLVATPNSFGKMGSKPSHPEMLDWLATWFVEHGWSIKRLHRLIVTSATYRQSGRHPRRPAIDEVDPNNRLLAYYPPRRLAAEEMRDGLLAITGELNREMGGPGIYPEINWEVAMQPRQIMGSVAPAYQPSPTPEQRNRRTIYAFRYRTLPDPLLEVFNRPGTDTSCARRDETTVTPQVFSQFNGQFVNDRALALADRIEKMTTDGDKRIDLAFGLVYGRAPTADERRLSAAHVAKMTLHHRNKKPIPEKLPTSVTREMVEELTGENFQFDEELDLMKDYQPDLKPWDVEPATRGLAELCLVLMNSNEFMYVY